MPVCRTRGRRGFRCNKFGISTKKTRFCGPGSLPPIAIVYVSHIEGQTRWRESFCNADFANFLADELVLWLRKEFLNPGIPVYLGGLSLTRLTAAHAALAHSGKFAGVLCQSASFWWNDQHLVNAIPEANSSLTKFRLTCGCQESQEFVLHGPELVQHTSQLASNRAMRDALLAKGYSVCYEEIDGGHDIASWKRDLPKAILALLTGILRPRSE